MFPDDLWFKGEIMYKILVLSFLACSCASIRGSHLAIPEQSVDQEVSQKGLIISSTEMRDLGSEHFVNIDLTLENKTNNYMNVKNVYLDFGNPDRNSQFKIISGQELVAWADAARQNVSINNHNASIILASVALAGLAVTAGSGDNTGLAIAGATTAVGATTVDAVRGVRNEVRTAASAQMYPNANDRGQAVPESHLYSGNFTVPPGLHSKKWVTIFSSNQIQLKKLRNAKMVVEYEDGQKENFNLKFREAI